MISEQIFLVQISIESIILPNCLIHEGTRHNKCDLKAD